MACSARMEIGAVGDLYAQTEYSTSRASDPSRMARTARSAQSASFDHTTKLTVTKSFHSSLNTNFNFLSQILILFLILFLQNERPLHLVADGRACRAPAAASALAAAAAAPSGDVGAACSSSSSSRAKCRRWGSLGRSGDVGADGPHGNGRSQAP